MEESINSLFVILGTTLLSGVFVSICASMFAKFLPKEETFVKRIAPMVDIWVSIYDKFIKRFLKPKEEDVFEEGVIATLCYWIEMSARRFNDEARKK